MPTRERQSRPAAVTSTGPSWRGSRPQSRAALRWLITAVDPQASRAAVSWASGRSAVWPRRRHLGEDGEGAQPRPVGRSLLGRARPPRAERATRCRAERSPELRPRHLPTRSLRLFRAVQRSASERAGGRHRRRALRPALSPRWRAMAAVHRQRDFPPWRGPCPEASGALHRGRAVWQSAGRPPDAAGLLHGRGARACGEDRRPGLGNASGCDGAVTEGWGFVTRSLSAAGQAAAGATLWLRRKTLSGSNCVLTAAIRR
jgi:hypothetical protein